MYVFFVCFSKFFVLKFLTFLSVTISYDRSINANLVYNENDLLKFLKFYGKPGDIFICLGAGSISQWVNKLPDTL